ncbi:MAG: aminotransferase class V-fold PLP-dependent enzyme [Candidatus Thorarchaeota archaeon]
MEKQSTEKALDELEHSIYTALTTYSNVHRGTGHFSMVTTALYEHAREIVLEFLNLDKDRYQVIFCNPRKAKFLKAHFKDQKLHIISSDEVGLPLGMRAVAILSKALPKAAIFDTGGGAVKMVYPRAVVWADAPNRFEAGTPNVINAIALAKALQLIKKYGSDVFKDRPPNLLRPTEILNRDEFTEHEGKELLDRLRQTLVGRDIRVPTLNGPKPYINLDNGASTPTFMPIWEAARQVLRAANFDHNEIIYEAKKICSEFLEAPLEKYDVIFVSNTTEAINLVAQNLRLESNNGVEPVVVTTLLEHNSNELPWRYFANASVIQIPVDVEGFLDLNKLKRLLCEYNEQHRYANKRIQIVAMCGASNVLGAVNDLERISQIVHQYGAHLLVDGAQLVAHHRTSLTEIDIDYFAFSGHKTYAPFGSGALIVKKGLLGFSPTELASITASGEENIVGIAAMRKSLLLLRRIGIDVIAEHERIITKRALQELVKIPNIEVFGVKDPKSARFMNHIGILVIRSKVVPHNLVAKELAEYSGIGVRNGCFCAHLLVSRLLRIQSFRVAGSKVLFRLIPNLTRLLLPGLIRLSFGLENDVKDVGHLVRCLDRINKTPRFFINRLIAMLANGSPFVPYTETEEQMHIFTKAILQQVYVRDH